MEFREGAVVISSDGKKVGHIRRVVIDPQTEEVTHLVIEKGFLFIEDRVIPIEKVASVAPDKILLQISVEHLVDMPVFEIEQYLPADLAMEQAGNGKSFGENYNPLTLYWYPAVGVAPVDLSMRKSNPGEPAATMHRTIPDNLVALDEGALVFSADDEPVGRVERVIANPDNDQVTHFVIERGALLKERKLIPIHWVESLGEEQVHLRVATQLLKQLPPYRED
jgi:uncharacterized protein YrrD